MSEARKSIFKEELRRLKENNYLANEDYEKVSNAYDQYYAILMERKQAEAKRLEDLRKAREAEVMRIAEERKAQLRLEKERKKLTPEQIRERNISFALIAGVFLLLLGGLVLATSSWDKMNQMMKVFSLAFVSMLFFGISYLTRKYLKIEKTAFAFLTLASLLIPVTFVGIGFFQLFGEWLSLYGEGRYVLGIITTLICLPLYTWIASKNNHRLFVWLTFLTLTAFTGFLLAATYVPIDLFYFGMIVYNGLLLVGYHYLKNEQKYNCFVSELPLFSQLNLVISSLLMLIIFENSVLYSVNILVTAVIYMAIVFVYNKKKFHYVFTLLFVYGMYQFLEHSFLQPFNYVGFAMIGFVYLMLEDRVSDHYLKKIFTATSGIVSGLAFLYISFEGLVLRADDHSLILLLAYFLIASNYIYLAFLTNRNVFQFLAPIFLVASGYQSWNLLSPMVTFDFFELYMFTVGVGLFVGIYVKNNSKYFLPIKQSSFYIAFITMGLTFLSSFIEGKFLELGLLLIMFGVILIVTNVIHPNKVYQNLAAWLVPLTWLLALIFIYEEFVFTDHFYVINIGMVGHLALSSLLLLAVSYWLRTVREPLFLPMFTISIAGYSISLLGSVSITLLPALQSSLYFIGIGVYLVLVNQTKNKHFWTFVAMTTAAFFLSLIELFKLTENTSVFVTTLFIVPVLLLLIAEFIGRKYPELKPYFFWTAHGFLGVFVVRSLGLYLITDYLPLALLIPLFIYCYSIFIPKSEWGVKLFLYFALTTLPINLLLFVDYYQINFSFEYSLTISVIIYSLLWGVSKNIWKTRIDLYILPFSLVTLSSFVIVEPLILLDLLLSILVSAFVIFLLYRRKWDIFSIVPLLFATICFQNYISSLDPPLKIMAYIVVLLLLQICGKLINQSLYFYDQTSRKYQIDWFTLSTPLFLLFLSETITTSDPLLLKLIPSVLFVFLLFMQINRVREPIVRNIVISATALATLRPYYLILDHVSVPVIIETELRLLPLISITIFLSKKAWHHRREIMKTVQAIVLVCVAVLIVRDALLSNTIYDALIVGALALVSIIAGMHYRIKSYFFVGTSVLFVNVLIQTKPFWGHLPWWMYLIIGGATLIGFASFYEWQKQRPNQTGKTLLQEKKEKFLKSWKEWE